LWGGTETAAFAHEATRLSDGKFVRPIGIANRETNFVRVSIATGIEPRLKAS